MPFTTEKFSRNRGCTNRCASEYKNRALRVRLDIATTASSVEMGMGYPVVALLVFGLAMVHGWLWSMLERRKAVEIAYDEIRKEVRRERGNLDRG